MWHSLVSVRSMNTTPVIFKCPAHPERRRAYSITSSARARIIGGMSRPSVFLGCAFVARQAALKDLTLDHLTNDRLHVCLCKRSQRLCANISKGATAQSKRGHGNVIWCLNNRDHVVLAQCPEGIPHGRSALLRHFSEGVRPFE